MQLIKTSYHLISTGLFIFAIILAHIFSVNPYDWTRNTISDLGAQAYDKKLIMQLGFLAFGLILVLGILLQGLSWRTLPILIYGLCIALTGVFCTKPFFPTEHYSELESRIHSTLAQLAGVVFTLGILIHIFYASNKTEKWLHVLFFTLVISLSAFFGLFKTYQGILQRLLYLTSFFWLVKFYRP